jgi:L-ascorbate metabolism protein UlaG (beta-lactamase superfamily)
MQIKKLQNNLFEIKSKEAAAILNDGVKIGEIEIHHPGEYEIEGIFVDGIASGEETVFSLCAEGLNVCFLGKLTKPLTKEATELLESVDILFLPAGAEGTVDIKQAKNILQGIDPRIVIPIYMKDEGEFLKLEGEATPRREKVLKIQTGQLPSEEEREIVILE